MDRNRIVEKVLSLPTDAIRRGLSSAVREAMPGHFVGEVADPYSDCARYAAKGNCELLPHPEFDQDFYLSVEEGELELTPTASWWIIKWKESTFEFVKIYIQEGYHRKASVLFIGKSQEEVCRFLLALEEFSQTLDGAVLVFQGGCWRYEQKLFENIQSSTFDNIVLPAGMTEQIRSDVQQWLDSRALYEEHGVPWKRGMIFVGPPGNGKTHMIKALANHFKLNTLYVRSFSAEYTNDSDNIAKVFETARKYAPSMLILEDLDTLVNPENRSFFLNELDGFAKNTGILAVASANDPAKLDPALVNRPSRFDRRYTFSLPVLTERSRFLQFFTSSLNKSLHLSDDDANAVGAETDGFSFAYLKELVLSSMMSWMSHGSTEPFAQVMIREAAPLKEQMELDPEPTPAFTEEESVAFKAMVKMRKQGLY